MARKKRDLVESVTFDSKTKLDKEKGIVHDVKILGRFSEHGYRYTDTAMKRAIPLYEGKPINIDHPKERSIGTERRYADRFGRIANVYFREGDNPGLYGKVHYNKGHALASQFEWDVENSPNNLGLSHMARGSTAVRSGKVLVESITLVKSVDLVADPATNTGLFESKGVRMKVRKKSRVKNKYARRRQLLESLREKIEDVGDDELSDLFEAAAPSEAPASDVGSPTEAMGKMIQAIFMDSSMEMDEKREKINAVLDLADDQEISTDDSESEDSEEEDSAAASKKGSELPESKGSSSMQKKSKKKDNDSDLIEDVADVKQELTMLRKERRVLELCESAGFKPTKIQKKALMGMQKVSEVKELIESITGASDVEERTSLKPPKTGRRRPAANADEDLDDKALENWAKSLT